MPIETTPSVDLCSPRTESELRDQVNFAEESEVPFVAVSVTPEEWEQAQNFLMQLRSANVGAVLHLKEGEDEIDDEEIQLLFGWLRDVDQMTVENFLVLCEDLVPKNYLPALFSEAKMELKWFREWLTAASDQRIAKYPALPWRGYIRKVVEENYRFASRFLQLAAAPAGDGTAQVMDDLIRSFLTAKKKVLCVFPKNWGKVN